MYRTITASDLREHQKQEFDHICQNHEIVLATRQKGENVVIMSESDFLELNETAYLLRTKNNRERLSAALKDKGKSFKSVQALEKALGI